MTTSLSSEDLLQRIDAKLERISRLIALQITSGMKQARAIELMNAAGLERRTISELLGTTPNTVSVTLAKAKAKNATTRVQQEKDSVEETVNGPE